VRARQTNIAESPAQVDFLPTSPQVSHFIMLRIHRLLAAVLLVFSANAVSASIAIDTNVSQDRSPAATTLVTPTFSTASANELLLAFVSADYLSGTNTSVTSMAGRADLDPGRQNQRAERTAEIWRTFCAIAAGPACR